MSCGLVEQPHDPTAFRHGSRGSQSRCSWHGVTRSRPNHGPNDTPATKDMNTPIGLMAMCDDAAIDAHTFYAVQRITVEEVLDVLDDSWKGDPRLWQEVCQQKFGYFDRALRDRRPYLRQLLRDCPDVEAWRARVGTSPPPGLVHDLEGWPIDKRVIYWRRR